MNKKGLLLTTTALASVMAVASIMIVSNKDSSSVFAINRGSPETRQFTFDKDTTGFSDTDLPVEMLDESGYEFASGRKMDLLFSYTVGTYPDNDEALKKFGINDNFMEGDNTSGLAGDVYLTFGINNLQSLSISFGLDEDAIDTYCLLYFYDKDDNDIGLGVETYDFTPVTGTTIVWNRASYDDGGNSNSVQHVVIEFGSPNMTSFYIESISFTWSC